MNVLILTAVAAAISAAPVPVPPAVLPPITPTVPVIAEQQKLAAELARVMNSEELMRAQLNKMLTDTVPKMLDSTPAFAAMEREHPGFSADFIAAMRPIVVDATIKRLPTLWARLVPIYTRLFTAAELRTLLDFYNSPVGVRVIKAMGEGSDYSRMLGDMVANGNNTVTANGIQAGVQSGIAQIVRTATPEDMKAMQALVATSAGRKLSILNPQLQAASVAWGNEPDPEANAQVEAAVKGVFAKYSGKPAQ